MQKKTLIIGLGQIGYHNAKYISKHGLYVEGFDLKSDAINNALESNVIKREAKNFKEYDYYLICISTHDNKDIKKPNFDALIEIAEKLKKEAKPGGLVSIESTITRGISKKINDILGHKLHVSHVPHRFYSKEKKDHGVKQLRILGGCNSCCTNEALAFYSGLLKIPIYNVSSIELAELSKVIENAYRFLQIAFAEELKMCCDKEGFNFNELREAINSKWNINLLEARQGIGGHCLPKDTKIFLNVENNCIPFSTLEAAMKVDEFYHKQNHDQDSLKIVLPRICSISK